jgi:succinyl-diaminopimelate desuccinylase
MDGYSDSEMLRTYSKIIGIRSISPESGGAGESKRADFLEQLLKNWELKPRRYDYIDNNKTKRSNIVVKYGSMKKTLWILAHIDTVSEGEMDLWKTDPFKAVIKNDRIYGRGAQDNGQGIIAGLYTIKRLKGSTKMKFNCGLVLAADEESGNRYGVQKLLKERIFGKDDIFVVPDWGSPKGNQIEIAEKGILWLKITATGIQVHASTPSKGINAFEEGVQFGLDMCRLLTKKYNKITKPFATPSTFVMTKHEKNLDSINIIPGKEVFYVDCRVLPNYRLFDVLKDMNRLRKNYRAKLDVEVVQMEEAPRPTRPDSEIVKALKSAIKRKLGFNAGLVGIGGGTVAAYLRHAGYDAAVWSIEDDIAHQPNEYAKISSIKKMIEIFVELLEHGS